ncbi:MAG: preprotein translocase subunit YajC [Acidobacteriota bacterium]
MPGPAQGQGGEPPTLLVLVPYVIVIGVLWYMLFVPARKKQKQTQELQDGLKSGDRVVMTCGIHGTIEGVHGNIVRLRVAEKVKIDVLKSSIAGKASDALPATEEKR